MNKYLDLTGLTYFKNKLQTEVSTAVTTANAYADSAVALHYYVILIY